MFIRALIEALQSRLASHRDYRRAIAEIEALTENDLIDLGAFHVDLVRDVRRGLQS